MTTYTPGEIGQAVFHINTAQVEDGNVLLHVIVDRHNNEAEECSIRFPVPDVYKGHEDDIPQFNGMHMVGFGEGGLLADARTVWGYVCPCNF